MLDCVLLGLSVCARLRFSRKHRAQEILQKILSAENLHLKLVMLFLREKRYRALMSLQYVIEKWEPGKWEPSCNLPPEFPEKWELSYLGPGGLDSVFYLPCTV